VKTGKIKRCEWPKNDLAMDYHDREWGVPVHDDRALFEALVLGGMQAGLSWDTILKKRENFRRAFDRFDPHKVARYNKRSLARLLADAGIIRNRVVSPEAEAMSGDLKKRGFKFVGPTICYAFMQAVGMVNDHTTDCFRYSQVGWARG